MTTDTPTPAEKARTRRRLITFGEVLTVLALVISALSFWDSHRDRVKAEAAESATTTAATRKAQVLLLRAAASGDGDRLALTPARDEQIIQSQTIGFPKALGISPVDTTGDSRIESGWFAAALKQAAKDKAPGDARFPVSVTTRYLVDGEPHEDAAIYDIGYTRSDRFLLGSEIKLRGMSLVGRPGAPALQAKLDARWDRQHPSK